MWSRWIGEKCWIQVDMGRDGMIWAVDKWESTRNYNANPSHPIGTSPLITPKYLIIKLSNKKHQTSIYSPCFFLFFKYKGVILIYYYKYASKKKNIITSTKYKFCGRSSLLAPEH